MNISTRKFTALISCLVLLVALGFGLYFTKATVSFNDIQEVWYQPPFSEATYVVGQYNSTFYYAKNCTNGNYDFLDTNATTVINEVFAALSSIIWETVYLRDNIIITSTLLPNSWTNIVLGGQISLDDTGTKTMLYAENKNHIKVSGGRWVGGYTTQLNGTPYASILRFIGCSYIDISNSQLDYAKYFPVDVENSSIVQISHLIINYCANAIALPGNANVTVSDIIANNVGTNYDIGAVVWVASNAVTINNIIGNNVGFGVQVEAFNQNVSSVTVSNVFVNGGVDSALWTDTTATSVGFLVIAWGPTAGYVSHVDGRNINVNGTQWGIDLASDKAVGISDVTVDGFSCYNLSNPKGSSAGVFVRNATSVAVSNGNIDGVNTQADVAHFAFGLQIADTQNSTFTNININNVNGSAILLGMLPGPPINNETYGSKHNTFSNIRVINEDGLCSNGYAESGLSGENLVYGNTFLGLPYVGGSTVYLANDNTYVGNNIGFLTTNGDTTSISDGGSIDHGLGFTPSSVVVSAYSPTIFATVSGLSTTHFHVDLEWWNATSQQMETASGSHTVSWWATWNP